MLDIVYGETANRTLTGDLYGSLASGDLTGTLYIGYPVLAHADEATVVDALLVCREHSLVVFEFRNSAPSSPEGWSDLADAQDALFFAVHSSLSRSSALRRERKLGVDINVVTLVPEGANLSPRDNVLIGTPSSALATIATLPALDEAYEAPVNAAIQRVATLKPKKRRASVHSASSKGAIMKQIEASIANLDKWQRGAAIETPAGPQRIRGLAGSGKTIVLALKAAYLHALHPDWRIALTFYTRSLHQQFVELVRRFMSETGSYEPDLSMLRIMHAWGSKSHPGVYSEIAEHAGSPVRDYRYARDAFGSGREFEGVCRELIREDEDVNQPLFDAVLIDEAQDLPSAFFRLVYQYTKDPKRITWAYDELQNLTDFDMPTVKEMFGTNDAGSALVHVENHEGSPRRDIPLPVCYRNTPWSLTLAHALGFGLYREGTKVQGFDDPSTWREIGYHVSEGVLSRGQSVVLERDPSSYPPYFDKLIPRDEAIQVTVFESAEEQASQVARMVKSNIVDDELEPDDILLVLTNPLTSKHDAGELALALEEEGVLSHTAGVTTSQDELQREGSVAIASIYRAKGNEAPMVYVVNSQHCYRGFQLIKLRNALFSAITRSRAWVHLCGWGDDMLRLGQEISRIQGDDYRLKFTIPTAEELERMRTIHRDLTPLEERTLRKAETTLSDILARIDNGEIAIENLSPERSSVASGLSRRELLTMKPGEVRADINRLVSVLVNRKLALAHNLAVSSSMSARSSRISWPGSTTSRALQFTRDSESYTDYLNAIMRGAFTAILCDGSLMQLSYDFKREKLIKHRLCFSPIPFDIPTAELLADPIVDVIETYASDPHEHRLRGAVRFDYSLSEPDPLPKSHVHLSSSPGRCAVFAPIGVGAFAEFVFQVFYPSIWDSCDELRAIRPQFGQRSLSRQSRTRLHLSCGRL